MRNITLRHLRSVLAVHQTGKISRAANTLGLTGPAVTLQLQQMEQELGVTLFERLSEGMRPTAAGQAVIDAAGSIEERLRILSEEISMIAKGRKGALKLAVVSTAKYFAPRLMAAFQTQNPDISMDLIVGNRGETIRSLQERNVDIALMGRPPRGLPVDAQVFGDHPLVIVANESHRLVGRRDITKEELAGEHFLIREQGSGTRMSLEIFFSGMQGRFEHAGSEMASNETIKQAVIAGLGIAFISAHTIELEVAAGRLFVLDVVGLPIRREWYSVWRNDRIFTPTMAAFNGFLAREGAKHLPVATKPYSLTSLGMI